MLAFFAKQIARLELQMPAVSLRVNPEIANSGNVAKPIEFPIGKHSIYAAPSAHLAEGLASVQGDRRRA